jgi:hypothetical protein
MRSRAVRLGIDRDGAQAEFTTGPDHPHGDFAPIRDEDGSDGWTDFGAQSE